MFCQSPCGTHTPEEEHMLLFSRFPSQTAKTVNPCAQGGNLLMFSHRSQQNHRAPGDKHCSLCSAARNGSHCSWREQRRHWQETCCGHTGLMLQSRNNDDTTPCRGTATSELHLLRIRLKIQVSSPSAFLLPPSAAVLCAEALWAQPCGTASS